MQATPLSRRWRIKHIESHRDGSRFAKLVAFGAASGAFLLACVGDRPSLVHIHASAGASFLRKAFFASVARRIFAVPVVFHMHSGRFESFYRDASAPLRFAIRRTLSGADRVVALGESWRRILRSIAPDASVEVVPNAVLVRPTPQDQRSPATVLYIGRIGEGKGAFCLIRAWARARLPSEARLIIAGDGEVERARALVHELALANVSVLGWQTQEAVSSLLDDSDVLALPSRAEGQPMAVLEAMGRGLAILVTPVGGIPDLLTQDACLFVPPDDEPALANALSRLVGSKSLRVRLGRVAHARAHEMFNRDLVWREIDRIYDQVARSN